MSLTKEEENLIHTLKDFRAVHDCLTYNLSRASEIQKRLEPRIKSLEERLDHLITDKQGESKC